MPKAMTVYFAGTFMSLGNQALHHSQIRLHSCSVFTANRAFRTGTNSTRKKLPERHRHRQQHTPSQRMTKSLAQPLVTPVFSSEQIAMGTMPPLTAPLDFDGVPVNLDTGVRFKPGAKKEIPISGNHRDLKTFTYGRPQGPDLMLVHIQIHLVVATPLIEKVSQQQQGGFQLLTPIQESPQPGQTTGTSITMKISRNEAFLNRNHRDFRTGHAALP